MLDGDHPDELTNDQPHNSALQPQQGKSRTVPRNYLHILILQF